jgi:hypothetical protein
MIMRATGSRNEAPHIRTTHRNRAFDGVGWRKCATIEIWVGPTVKQLSRERHPRAKTDAARRLPRQQQPVRAGAPASGVTPSV